MQIIELNRNDDIVSVCDRLAWADEPRVLLVLPADGKILRREIDQVRLRRCADSLRIDVALVAEGEETLKRQAWALGIPVFGSVAAAQRGRRHWRPRRQEMLGLLGAQGWAWPERPQAALPADRPGLIGRGVWLLLVVFLAGLFVTLALFLPRATITLQPIAQTVAVNQTITADTTQRAADVAAGVVPARLVTQTLSSAMEMDVEGVVSAADQEQLHAEALLALAAEAFPAIEGQLDAQEWLLRESVQVVEIHEEDYSATVGTTARQLILHLSATVEGVAVDEGLVNGVLYEALLAALPVEYALLPDRLQAGELEVIGADAAGRWTFVLSGAGLAVAELNMEPIRATVIGQPVNQAGALLAAALPLAETISIEVQPAWWGEWIGRLPFRAEQIEIKIGE